MKKSILAISVTAIFSSLNTSAATLPDGAVLSIEAPSKFVMGPAGPYNSNCDELDGSDVDLVGAKGLYVGSNMDDISSGSHGSLILPADRGASTEMWEYFNNTGVHFMSTTVGSGSFSGDTNPLIGADMSGWTVSWNAIPHIPMGGCHLGADYESPLTPGLFISACDDGFGLMQDDSAPSALACGSDCSDGDSYTITHTAHVPYGDPSNFGGVAYNVCLKGTIQNQPVVNTAPVANDDSYIVATDAVGEVLGIQYQPGLPGVVFFSIARNDFDNDINDGIDITSVDLDPVTAGIQTTVTTALGGTATVGLHAADPSVVFYDTPGGGITGEDSFSYSIADLRGGLRSTASVTIAVGNVAPVANDDTGLVDLKAGDTFVDINVLANDTDLNGNGTIDSTMITVVTPPSNGSVVDQTGGVLRYTPTPAFTGADTFTYTVIDNDVAPLVSNEATVVVKVSNAGIPIGPFLVLTSGLVGTNNIEPALGEGSWFSMELSPGSNTYTAVVGFNHIELETTQSGLSPNKPNIDSPWTFFGNLGVHQTTSALQQLSNDDIGNVLLDFSGWNVSWNGIPSIKLGGGQDNGVATLKCFTDLLASMPGTCAAGDQFLLTYRAIVPPGDISGFGGVNYAVHFEGSISDTAPVYGCGEEAAAFSVDTASAIGDCAAKTPLSLLPGATAQAMGNTTGLYLSVTDINKKDPSVNPVDGQQCIGGCLDFIVDNVTTGEVSLVVKLNAPIPEGASYRKLVNGRWKEFDTSGNDQIGSAAADPVTGSCQGPEGVFRNGLRSGYKCLYLKIIDGGPNDADDLANGTIVDPGGITLSGSPNVPASSTSGCSISSTPVDLTQRLDWLLVIGFIALMGVVSFVRNHKNNYR